MLSARYLQLFRVLGFRQTRFKEALANAVFDSSLWSLKWHRFVAARSRWITSGISYVVALTPQNRTRVTRRICLIKNADLARLFVTPLWWFLFGISTVLKNSMTQISWKKFVNEISYYSIAKKWNSCAVSLRVDAYVMHHIIITIHCRQWVPIRYFKLICHFFLLRHSLR